MPCDSSPSRAASRSGMPAPRSVPSILFHSTVQIDQGVSSMNSKDPSRIDSGTAPEPVGAYPHARRAGNLLFLSGVGPRKRGTKEIPGVVLGPDGTVAEKDIEAQCRSCFDNVRAVMADAGYHKVDGRQVDVKWADGAKGGGGKGVTAVRRAHW